MARPEPGHDRRDPGRPPQQVALDRRRGCASLRTVTSGGAAASAEVRAFGRRSPSRSAVLTMITEHRALWEMRLGTLPRRNSRRSCHAQVPDHDDVHALGLSAVSTMAAAMSLATTTLALPRSPASSSAYVLRSSAAN